MSAGGGNGRPSSPFGLALLIAPGAALDGHRTNSTVMNATIDTYCDCWQATTHINSSDWRNEYIGYGSTESEAIADLIQILRDELEARHGREEGEVSSFYISHPREIDSSCPVRNSQNEEMRKNEIHKPRSYARGSTIL